MKLRVTMTERKTVIQIPGLTRSALTQYETTSAAAVSWFGVTTAYFSQNLWAWSEIGASETQLSSRRRTYIQPKLNPSAG